MTREGRSGAAYWILNVSIPASPIDKMEIEIEMQDGSTYTHEYLCGDE